MATSLKFVSRKQEPWALADQLAGPKEPQSDINTTTDLGATREFSSMMVFGSFMVETWGIEPPRLMVFRPPFFTFEFS
jgi:hypothetical protein